MELGLIFVSGLLLSLHCVGMCGGFVALLAVRGSSRYVPVGALTGGIPSISRVLTEQFVFNAGRLVTYTGLGALCGAAGSLGAVVSRTGTVQAMVMLAAGTFLAASGLALAGFLKHWSLFSSAVASPRPWLAAAIQFVLRLPPAARSLPLGLLWGFLPCGLIYAMLAKAAATGSAAAGALTMLAFGAGTLPALLLVALSADAFSLALRQRMVRVSGIFLAAIGMWTLVRGALWLGDAARGVLPGHHHLG
jgi:sulfite exporter TauE/SafE